MKIYFTTAELCITDKKLPIHVAQKIWAHHILVMNPIREKMGVPITASANSGYRPYKWEIAHGRSGKSQHTFGDRGDRGTEVDCLGAVDWTTVDPAHLDELEANILVNTKYTRVARYATFIHCDYRPTPSGNREYYTSGADSKWTFIREIK